MTFLQMFILFPLLLNCLCFYLSLTFIRMHGLDACSRKLILDAGDAAKVHKSQFLHWILLIVYNVLLTIMEPKQSKEKNVHTLKCIKIVFFSNLICLLVVKIWLASGKDMMKLLYTIVGLSRLAQFWQMT